MKGLSEPDPARPWKWPHIFLAGKCGICEKCFIDRRNGRCPYGGPFNHRYQFDPSYFRVTNEEEAA